MARPRSALALSASELIPIGAGAALVALAAAQLASPWRPQPPAPPPISIARPSLVSAPPIPSYPAITQTPLFVPDRRSGGGPGGGPGGLDSWRALGAASGGGLANAVVQGPYGPPRSISPGENLEGWRLLAIAPGRLVFGRGAARKALVVGAAAVTAVKAGPATGPDADVQP